MTNIVEDYKKKEFMENHQRLEETQIFSCKRLERFSKLFYQYDFIASLFSYESNFGGGGYKIEQFPS